MIFRHAQIHESQAKTLAYKQNTGSAGPQQDVTFLRTSSKRHCVK